MTDKQMKHTPILTVERDSPMKDELHIKLFHEGLEYAWFRWDGNCFSGWLTDEQISQLFTSVNGYSALQEQNKALREALKGMVDEWEQWEELEERTHLNSGCIECTAGTVPNHLNTGLCVYHKARSLLADQGK